MKVEQSRDGVKVLIVDDTDHVRAMLVDMLELDGFNVVGQASSGHDGIILAGKVDPDVIVMDYRMPEINGLGAARAIRENRPEQAIILYTAYLEPELEAMAKDAGVAVVIGKVEGLNQLERHISELVRDYGAT
jgi:DNA-binding NarL/FixJ family response regulator